MTIFFVETYVIKPDKLVEFAAFLKKFETYAKEHPALFKEMKSHKLFSNMFGTWGGYVEMWESENFADGEKLMSRMMQDKEFMTLYLSECAPLEVPGTHSIGAWNPVM